MMFLTRRALQAAYVPTTLGGHIIRGDTAASLITAASQKGFTDPRWVTASDEKHQPLPNATPVEVMLSCGSVATFFNASELCHVMPYDATQSQKAHAVGSHGSSRRPTTIIGGFFNKPNAEILNNALQQMQLPTNHWVTEEEALLLNWTIKPDAIPVELPAGPNGTLEVKKFYNVDHVDKSAAGDVTQWFHESCAQYGVTGPRYASPTSIKLVQFLSRFPIQPSALQASVFVQSLAPVPQSLCGRLWGTESSFRRVLQDQKNPQWSPLITECLERSVPCSVLINGQFFQMYAVAQLGDPELQEELWKVGVKNVESNDKSRLHRPAAATQEGN